MNLDLKSLKKNKASSESQTDAAAKPLGNPMRIELKDLAFGYGSKSDKKMVLHDINLVIDKPGFYCIIGPNGVGKSTLIKCINKILKPTSGSVLIDGVNVADMSLKDIASRIGYVPVQTQDVFSMPVVDAILLGRQTKSGWKTSSEDLEIASRVMKMLGIEDLAMRGFNHLSAGQHQKVSLARGLVQRTDVLILDEPTANLDVQHQVYVSELLRGLAVQENKIILMISHDLNISAKYAHEVIVMEKGTVVKVGPPAEVIDKELIQRIYNVDCEILMCEGHPHILLGSVRSI